MSVLGSLLPRTRFIVSSVAAAFLVLPGPAAAQPRPFPQAQAAPEHVLPLWTIEPMGAWGGPVNAFEKHGDIGFVGSGQRLVTLDLSDLTDVRELGAVKLGTPVMDLTVRDGLAYVVTSNVARYPDAGLRHSWFHVVDATNPVQPELIWSDDGADNSFSSSLAAIRGFYGDYAFLTASPYDTFIADLTDPRNPVLIEGGFLLRNPAGGSIGGISDMVIRGDLAFVTSADAIGRLRVFDLSTIVPGVWPLEPQHVGAVSFFIERYTYKLAVDGGWAYVAVHDEVDEQEKIWAVDVSDPASPVKHGVFDGFPYYFSNGREIHDLAIEGGRLYAANGPRGVGQPSLGLATFDIATDPAQPALIASYRTHGSVRGVSAEGDTVYLRDWGEGLIVMDAADPADPLRLDNYHSPAQPGATRRDGDLLYVSDAWNGLSILDVSDLSQLTLLGVYQTTERPSSAVTGLDYLDGHVYLAAGDAGLEVIDVSDRTNPVFRGALRFPPSLPCSYTAGRLVAAVDDVPGFAGKVVYLSVVESPCGFGALLLYSIDVTDPAAPTLLDSTPGSAENFARASAPGRFFLAQGTNDPARLLDGSDPTDLRVDEIAGQTGESSDDVYAVSYDADRGWLYLFRESFFTGNQLVAMDLASDWEGVEINALEELFEEAADLASHPRGVVVLGRISGGGWTGNRVALVDMTPPAPPRVLASTRVGFSSGDGRVVASDDGAIFVSSFNERFGLSGSGSPGLETFRLRVAALERVGP